MTQQVISRNIYVHTNIYMHAVIMKRDYKFEGCQEDIYGRVWREEWGGRN